MNQIYRRGRSPQLSATIAVDDHAKQRLGSGQFTDKAGYAAVRSYAGKWPDRGLTWPRAPTAQASGCAAALEVGKPVVDVQPSSPHGSGAFWFIRECSNALAGGAAVYGWTTSCAQAGASVALDVRHQVRSQLGQEEQGQRSLLDEGSGRLVTMALHRWR